MKLKKPKPRNPFVVAASTRSGAGPMKHRLESKQGAKNDQPELLTELDPVCEFCDDVGSHEGSTCPYCNDEDQ